MFAMSDDGKSLLLLLSAFLPLADVLCPQSSLYATISMHRHIRPHCEKENYDSLHFK